MKLNEKLELIEAIEKRLKREVKAFGITMKQREDINRPDWATINSKFNTQRRKIDLIKAELRGLKRNRTVFHRGFITSYRFSFGRGQMVSIDN
jgi:hypothetical protein